MDRAVSHCCDWAISTPHRWNTGLSSSSTTFIPSFIKFLFVMKQTDRRTDDRWSRQRCSNCAKCRQVARSNWTQWACWKGSTWTNIPTACPNGTHVMQTWWIVTHIHMTGGSGFDSASEKLPAWQVLASTVTGLLGSSKNKFHVTYVKTLFKTPTKCTTLSLLLCINQPLHMFRSYIRPSSGQYTPQHDTDDIKQHDIITKWPSTIQNQEQKQPKLYR